MENGVSEHSMEVRCMTDSVDSAAFAGAGSSPDDQMRALAHEVHDAISGELTLMGFAVSDIERVVSADSFDRAAATAAIASLRAGLARAHQASRSVENRLCPAILKSLGLLEALEELTFEFSRPESEVVFGMKTDLQGLSLPLSATLQIYRIAQESLNNAAKHAPGPVIVTVGREGDELCVSIDDSGTGFPPHALEGKVAGQGLRALAWRAHQLGGTLDLVAKGGRLGGAAVRLRVPKAF